jgi:sulfoacetaldehyde dehydrogenase
MRRGSKLSSPCVLHRQVDDLITGMVYAVAKEDTAKMIAQHTVDETRLGNYNGKFLKIFRKTRATLMDIIHDKSVGVIEEDPIRNIVKVILLLRNT